MKNAIAKSSYKIYRIGSFLLLGFMLCLPNFGEAQVQRTKEFQEEYSGKTSVKISHRRGPLIVKKSNDGKVRIHVKMTVSGKDEAVINTVFDQFKVQGDGVGGSLDLDLKLPSANWITINGVTKIKFEDGTEVKGLKKFESEFTLWIPDLKSLSLENKYNEIKIEPDLAGDLKVDLYSGKLYTQNVAGNLDLSMKYGKAYMKNVGNADIDIYDSDIELGNAGIVNMEGKYSEVRLGDCEELKLATYDGNLRGGHVKGDLRIADKYSDVKIKSFRNGKVDMYDGFLLVEEKGKSLEAKSKYTEYKIPILDNLDFSSSYDDDVEVDRLNNFKAISKNGEFHIGTLLNSISLIESYDDDVEIDELSANFESIELDGKYIDMTIKTMNDAQYSLDVIVRKGDIDYPENRFEDHYFKQVNSTLEIRGKTKGATEKSGKIKVRGYDNSLSLD